MINSHLQPAIPLLPFRFPRIPAAISPPNIWAIALPEYSQEIRRVSSARVYHELMRKTAPGKNGASTKPRRKRTTTSEEKLWTAELQVEITPQTIMTVPRYSEGLAR